MPELPKEIIIGKRLITTARRDLYFFNSIKFQTRVHFRRTAHSKIKSNLPTSCIPVPGWCATVLSVFFLNFNIARFLNKSAEVDLKNVV